MGNAAKKGITRPRYDFIDILRIVACFLVIVNHTITFVFYGAEPSRGWFVSVVWFYISKLSVPVFVMITGYTLLDRQDDYKKSAIRVLKAIVALFVFSFGYYMFQWFLGDRVTIGVVDFVMEVLEHPLSLAYWYMYMYIGLLIMMPFLQKFATSLSKKDVEILILISLFFYGTCPILEHWIPEYEFTRLLDVALFDSYIGMVFISYYMKKYLTPSKKLLIGSGIAFVVCILFNVVMTYHEYLITGGDDYLFYDDRVLVPNIIVGASFFYMVSQIKIKPSVVKVLKVVAGCTFGIFLISDLIIAVSQSVYHGLCATGINAIIAMVIYEVIVFVVGFVLVFIMKKIPLLKKIL